MKKRWIAYLALLVLGTSMQAGTLKLEWVEPENFRDADYHYRGGEKSKRIVTSDLERYFNRQARQLIPEGYVLEMRVTDLDLAGEFEPWRGGRYHNVRIIKPIYPAMIEFDYRLLNTEEEVVSEGNERLRDTLIPRSTTTAFLGRSESFPYVKELVRRWMRALVRS